MNNLSIQSLLFATLISLPVFSMADSDHHGKGRFMALFDTNADDVVTMEEFKQAAAERYKLMDRDNSGAVTQEEFGTYLSEKRQMWKAKKFEKADADKDGNITQAEYLDYRQQEAQRRFQKMDSDGNGLLSAEEFSKGRSGGRKCGKHGSGNIFAKLDKNGNGEITQEESLTAWTEWFTKIDSNGDNVVTAEEVREYRLKNFSDKN